MFSLRDICNILWYNYYVYDETVGTLMNSMLNSTESIDDLGQTLLMIRTNSPEYIIFDKYFERKIIGWVNAFKVFMSKVSIF